jgi:MFS superfamily sulfate permease-like transporter
MIDMTPTLLGLKLPEGQCQDRTHILTTLSPFTHTDNPTPESPFQTFFDILSHLRNAHFLTTTLSITSILFLLGSKWIKKLFPRYKKLQLVPEILILVVLSTFLTWLCRWDCKGLAILNIKEGSLPSDVKTYPMPTAGKIKHLLLSAILISVIGFVESIVVAKTYASKHRYGVSPNRELVAIGVANIISSLFGGFPSYGSLGRSAVNDAAGAQTQLSGFVTGLVVFMTSMWFLPLFQYLPKAVCSSIIVVAALKLIELEEVYFLIKIFAWQDLGLLLMTFASTIFISIETGTLLSVGVSLLLVVKHTTTV